MAVKNAGQSLPRWRMIVNHAPALVREEGLAYSGLAAPLGVHAPQGAIQVS